MDERHLGAAGLGRIPVLRQQGFCVCMFLRGHGPAHLREKLNPWGARPPRGAQSHAGNTAEAHPPKNSTIPGPIFGLKNRTAEKGILISSVIRANLCVLCVALFRNLIQIRGSEKATEYAEGWEWSSFSLSSHFSPLENAPCANGPW